MDKIDFLNYKFRASQVGKIMSKPKSKSEVLSKTAKTFLHEVYIEEVYKRSRDVSTKYMEKGNLVEEDSFAIIQHYLNNKLILKNTRMFENDYIKGTPDIILPDLIIDAKSSWDIWTFVEADGKNKDYMYQGMCYMWLKDIKKFKLIYCLNNTPEHLVVQEKIKLKYQRGLDDGSKEMAEMEYNVEMNNTFDDIPIEKRYKVFDFDYEDKIVEDIKSKIIIAREYLNSLSF